MITTKAIPAVHMATVTQIITRSLPTDIRVVNIQTSTRTIVTPRDIQSVTQTDIQNVTQKDIRPREIDIPLLVIDIQL